MCLFCRKKRWHQVIIIMVAILAMLLVMYGVTQQYRQMAQPDIKIASALQEFKTQVVKITINAGSLATTVTAPASFNTVDPDKTIALISGVTQHALGRVQQSNQNPDDIATKVELNSGTSITVTRDNAFGQPTTVWVLLIEYTGAPGGVNEFVVRDRRTETWSSGQTARSYGIISSVVDTNKVVVFNSGVLNPNTNSNQYDRGDVKAYLDGSKQVQLNRGDGNGAIQSVHQVVEFTGSNWTIQTGDTVPDRDPGGTDVSINPVSGLDKAWVYFNWQTNSANLDERGHRVWLTNINTLRVQEHGAATANKTIRWYVIENPDMVVQTGAADDQFQNLNSATITGFTPVTSLNNSFAWVHGMCNGGGNAHPRDMWQFELQNTGTIALERGYNGQNLDYRYFVVELPVGNEPPTGTFNVGATLPRVDGTGLVDVSFDVADPEQQPSLAKLEYTDYDGFNCNIGNYAAATLQVPVTATNVPAPNINNSNPYQLGDAVPIITTSTNTITVLWDSATDLAGLAGNYCLRLTVNDGNSDQVAPAETVVVIDNQAPVTPVVTSPIIAADTVITGTSTELDGTQIEVFVDTISVGTTTVTANAWSLVVAANELQAAETVTAQARDTYNNTSAISTGVVVQSLVSPIPMISSPILAGDTMIAGTSSGPDGTIITIYNGTNILGIATVNAGVWKLTGLIDTSLQANDLISATATIDTNNDSVIDGNDIASVVSEIITVTAAPGGVIRPFAPEIIIVSDNDCVSDPQIEVILRANLANEYILSEDSDFNGATWQPWQPGPKFEWWLSEGDGIKRLYAQFRNNLDYRTEIVSTEIEFDQTTQCGQIELITDNENGDVLDIESGDKGEVVPPVPALDSENSGFDLPGPFDPADFTLPPMSEVETNCEFNCESITYGLYIINPDGSQRHANSVFVRPQQVSEKVIRYFFEDSDFDNDYNDLVIEVDSSDCDQIKVTLLEVLAGWAHEVHLVLFNDGQPVEDIKVWANSQEALNKTVIINLNKRESLCKLASVDDDVTSELKLDELDYRKVQSNCSKSLEFQSFLQIGDTNIEVRALQELLQCLGYFPDDINSTAIYGPITVDAVSMFQQEHLIPAVGYVGPQTRAALNSY